MAFAPELVLLIGSLLVFLATLGENRGGLARNLTLVVAVGALVSAAATLGQQQELFFHAYRVDLFSQLFKVAICIGLGLVVLFGSLKGVNEQVRAEYFLFLLLSTAGLVFLVSSVELITMVVAMELSSYSVYLLVPMRDDRTGVRMQMEAAIKYVMFGVIATGIMLFGMSYLFGLTGTTYLHELLPRLQALGSSPAVIAGLAMVLGGFFYKLALFPFHFWVPDVYQGAANDTTAYLATVPKLAAVALLIRLSTLIGSDGEALVKLMMVFAIGSMFYGNLSALVQKDVKRLLGFSGIAHAGLILLGLVTLRDYGYAAAIYYIVAYLFMNLACFLVVSSVSEDGGNVAIEDLNGLYRRSPLLAVTLLIGMFALAGIPPFVGFMGEFFLMTGALKAGYLPLVIVAAVNTGIGIYYYLKVVHAAFTTPPDERPPVFVNAFTGAVSIFLMAVIVTLGCLPSRIFDIATTAVRSLL